jgi:hypothetical protein
MQGVDEEFTLVPVMFGCRGQLGGGMGVAWRNCQLLCFPQPGHCLFAATLLLLGLCSSNCSTSMSTACTEQEQEQGSRLK